MNSLKPLTDSTPDSTPTGRGTPTGSLKPANPSLCHLCQKQQPLPGYQFCGGCWSAIQRQGRPASLAPPPTSPILRYAATIGGFSLFALPAFGVIFYPSYVLFGAQAQAALASEGWNKIHLPFGMSLAFALPLVLGIVIGLAAGAYGSANARAQCVEEARLPTWAYTGLLLLGFVGGAVYRALSGPIP